MSCTPPRTRSRRACRSPARASCSARAARGMAPDGPARLGVLALDGALADPSGPGSRSDEVVHALWWLIVELADERPLALFLDDAQWADELTLRLLRTGRAARVELPLALVVAARPAGPGQRHAVLAAERAFVRLEPAPLSVAGTARLIEAVLARPGVRRGRRTRAGRDRRQPALSPGAVSTGPRRRRRPHERQPPAAAARAARRGSARPAHRRRGRARARRRGAGADADQTPGARARRARGERGDRRRGGAARRAGARRRRVRLRAPAGRGGGARGDRQSGRGRAACARGRAARRRRGGRPARRRAPAARAAARRRRPSWRRCAGPPTRRGASAP